MTIELTEKERLFLTEFAKKQFEGAKDNVSTRTPIHVVERICKEFVEDGSGEVWRSYDDYYTDHESFDELIAYYNKNDTPLPNYEEVEYETINDTWICDEKSYLEAYGIIAYPGKYVTYTTPVAYFFILDEAKRYKNEYQKHNCADCRIYTYGLGYNNCGDMPIFRSLLMRIGESLL